ncbi:hypothetical protein [Streptomyces sp. NPDC059247]|uniref:hypothetical protein n=1 Tax=Streptomyces sp. NPDC059247 TaxID=3346790 RepID=UPI00368213D6
MTAAAEKQLTRADLLHALEAVDKRALDGASAPGGNGSGAEETYQDLPTPVLDIFHEDGRQFDAIFAVNIGKTRDSIQQYRDGQITEARFKELLKAKDEASLAAVDARLDQSREELADELTKYSSEVQQEGLRARSAETAAMGDALDKVSAQKSWTTMTPDEAEAWLRGVLKEYDDHMKRLFG